MRRICMLYTYDCCIINFLNYKLMAYKQLIFTNYKSFLDNFKYKPTKETKLSKNIRRILYYSKCHILCHSKIDCVRKFVAHRKTFINFAYMLSLFRVRNSAPRHATFNNYDVICALPLEPEMRNEGRRPSFLHQ